MHIPWKKTLNVVETETFHNLKKDIPLENENVCNRHTTSEDSEMCYSTDKKQTASQFWGIEIVVHES